MNPCDDPTFDHARVQRLLPWLLTGTLASTEQALVEQHLRACDACRRDLVWQRRVRAAGRAGPILPPGLDADAALARLLPRLDARRGRGAELRRWVQALAANDSRWWRPLAAAQFAVIAALAALLASTRDTGQARYRLLGEGSPVLGDLVVSFRPDTPERELRRILVQSDTHMVDGPTAAGAYVLSSRGAAPARALARLRAEPAVTLAEPLAEPLTAPSRP